MTRVKSVDKYFVADQSFNFFTGSLNYSLKNDRPNKTELFNGSV